jgi:uncharacterized membrane protein YqjE
MDTAADRGPDSARAPFARGPGVSKVPTPAEAASHESAFLEPLERMFASLKRMAGNYALLAVLDMRRAAVQLAWLVGAGILIAVLVVTAWLAGVVALAVWLLGQGLSWPAVLGIAALLNLVGAGLVVWRVKDVFEHAPFSATLKQIRGDANE